MKKSKRFYGIRKKLVIVTILAAILPLGIMGVVLAGSINRCDGLKPGELFPQQQQNDRKLSDDGTGV